MCDCEYEEQKNEPENKKFELVDASNYGYGGAYRIRALRDFGDVQKGMLGGYVEEESCLSHEGDCWIYGNSFVGKNCRIKDHSKVYENTRITGEVVVSGNSVIGDRCYIMSRVDIHDSKIINTGTATLSIAGDGLLIDRSFVGISLCGLFGSYRNAKILKPDDLLFYGNFEKNIFVYRTQTKCLAFGTIGFKEYSQGSYGDMVAFFAEKLTKVSKRQVNTIKCMIAAIDDNFDEVDLMDDINRYYTTKK